MSAITFHCPNCGGALVFEPESGQYTCEYCLSKFSQEELDKKAKAADRETKQKTSEKEGSAVVYHCNSCGAEIVTDETTAATFCFYCHNPVILSGRLEGEYLPDGVIPFKITKDEALEHFHKWIGKKKFILRGFYSKRQIEKMTGVYFPYWLYGCETESYLNATARNVRVWCVGETEYTETKTYEIRRAGRLSFRHLPKTALQKAETAMLKGIFPYHFDALEKFHMGYLSGFQAEKRDIGKESLTEELRSNAEKYAKKRLEDTVTGYQSFHINSQNHAIREEKFQYVLLPVWVLTYRARKNAVYYFAMNGQTGEIVGKLPVDWKKLSVLFGIVFMAVFALLMLGGLLL